MAEHVFLCYSRRDEAFVLALATALKERGVPVWLDQWSIHPGLDWDKAVDDALYSCDKLIVVLSPSAVESRDVRTELRAAFDARKPIIPIVHKPCRAPRYLSLIQRIDFSDRAADEPTALRRLLEALARPGMDSAALPGAEPGSEARPEMGRRGASVRPSETDDAQAVERIRVPVSSTGSGPTLGVSVGIETLGGVFTVLIPRGAALPTLQKETYSTAEDLQTTVEVHLLVGERPMASDNLTLGRFTLSQIPPMPRGLPQIEVTFAIDSHGILDVSAQERDTGKRQQLQIHESLEITPAEAERLIRAAEKHRNADKTRKEEIETRNRLDSSIYNANGALKSWGTKLTKQDRATVEEAIQGATQAAEHGSYAEMVEAAGQLDRAIQLVISKFHDDDAQDFDDDEDEFDDDEDEFDDDEDDEDDDDEDDEPLNSSLDLTITTDVTTTQIRKQEMITVKSPRGHSLRIKLPPNARDGTRLRFRNEGIGGMGDLYVRLRVR